MTIRAFSSMVTRLAPSVPGCPQPVIEQYVRDSAMSTPTTTHCRLRYTRSLLLPSMAHHLSH